MTADDVTPGPELGRRRVLLGAGAVGIAGVLAACGGDGSDSAATSPSPTGDAGDDAPDGEETPDVAETEPPEETESPDDAPTGGGDGLVAASEVPVGGGVILAGEEVVVTQPVDGEFKGFSSTCTHQGCTVGEVSDGLIRCPCHGSRYFVEDGTVENGPATQPLPEVAISVAGDQIVRA